MKSKKNSKLKDRLWTVVLVAIFFLGVLIMLYPTLSNWWYVRTSTRAIMNYDEVVSGLSEEECEALLEEAREWNAYIADMGSYTALLSDNLDERYDDILDVTGTGIMGYITITKIKVNLPIYHGTSDSVLVSGVGHLEGSSFPIGGESTHSVISGHRGLPSATLFTRLDELEKGDTFTITILNQVLTYEVDKITVVDPDEIEDLYIVDGEDYVTLMTCTPYGINTHRLLVRGKRIETSTSVNVTADATQVNPIIVAVFIAVPMAVIGVVIVVVRRRKKKKQEA